MTPEEFAICLRRCSLKPGERVLAAVSGGADSMCLLALLCGIRETYPLEVVCAHAEHGLRGEESIADERFVREACEERSVPFYCRHLDVLNYSRQKGIGIEEAARELRYAFLRETMVKTGCSVIATAHHLQDQAETLLLRLARGTDLRGLSGMRMRANDLIRPFLNTPPEKLRSYLLSEGLSWREDASNMDARFARNRIRATVLPELCTIYPEARGAIARFAEAAARDEEFFSQILADKGLHSPIPLADGAALPRRALIGLHPSLVSRAIRKLLETAEADFSSRTVLEASRTALLPQGSAVINLPGNGRLTVGKRIVSAVFPQRSIATQKIFPGRNKTSFGEFFLGVSSAGACDGKRCQIIPKNAVPFLSVGETRAGESMIPFGWHTPVSLLKLIKNARIEANIRRSVPVIRKGNDALWLGGVRAAESCRCNEEGNWLLEWDSPIAALIGSDASQQLT